MTRYVPGIRKLREKQRAADIAALARQGLCSSAIAREIGYANGASVKTVAARHKISLPEGRRGPTHPAIRDQVGDMLPLEAVEHLLFVVEQLLGTPEDLVAAVDRLGVQPGPAKAYLALERAAGRVLTFDALTQAMAFDPTTPPSRSNLANAIAKLRPALPPGESIVTVHGIGYRLEKERPVNGGD